MITRVFQVLLVGLTAIASGCAMCSSCDDYSYAAFGGRWQRTDMTYGRVGSAFTDVGIHAMDEDGMLDGSDFPALEFESEEAPSPAPLEAGLQEGSILR